jgi:hypothetical protein
VTDVPMFLPGSYAYSEIESQKYKKLPDFQIISKMFSKFNNYDKFDYFPLGGRLGRGLIE